MVLLIDPTGRKVYLLWYKIIPKMVKIILKWCQYPTLWVKKSTCLGIKLYYTGTISCLLGVQKI